MVEDWNIVLSVLESPDPAQVGYQKVFTASPIRIGRADESDFILNDPTVSRGHAALRVTNDYSRVFITDTSTHGTSVSDRPVPKGLGSGFTLQTGDSLCMGQSLVRFEFNLKQSVQSTLIGTMDRSFLDAPAEDAQAPAPATDPAEEEFASSVAKPRSTSLFSLATIAVCVLVLIYLAFFQ